MGAYSLPTAIEVCTNIHRREIGNPRTHQAIYTSLPPTTLFQERREHNVRYNTKNMSYIAVLR